MTETPESMAKQYAEAAARWTPRILDTAMRAADIAAGHLRVESNRLFEHRTGALATNWVRQFLSARDGELRTGALSNVAYADIQDRGGTIVPRTRKYLAIPLLPFAEGKWPRHFPRGELRFVPAKGRPGGYLVRDAAGKRGQGKIGEAIFRLVPSVTIRGRGYIEYAARKAEPEIETLFERAAQSAGEAT